MIRYKKRITSGVFRIPIEVREAFGEEIYLAPGLKAAALYPVNESTKAVIKSLQLVIEELKQEARLKERIEAEHLSEAGKDAGRGR